MNNHNNKSNFRAGMDWWPFYLFSISTYLYIGIWREIFIHGGVVLDSNFMHRNFWSMGDNLFVYLFASLICVTFVWLILGALYLFCKFRGKAQRKIYINTVSWIFAVHMTLYVLTRHPVKNFNSQFSPWLIAATALILIAVVYRYRRIFNTILIIGLIVISPFSIFVVGNVLANAFALSAESPSVFSHEKPLAPHNKTRANGHRVVWIIFDEWDYRQAFEDRHPELKTPTLDDLLESSFHATNAQQPGPTTTFSIPTYFTGRTVKNSKVNFKDDMSIQYQGETEFVRWSRQPSIFKYASDLKLNTAILSHRWVNYCRMIHSFVQTCWDSGRWWNGQKTSLFSAAIKFFPSFTGYYPIIGKSLFPTLAHENVDYVNEFKKFHSVAITAAANPKYDFVFLHWMVPHFPFFYDIKKQELASHDKGESSYYENLALVDSILSSTIKKMQKEKIWANTTLILTSDHHLRTSGNTDDRVPLIIKLANTTSSYTYTKPFNTKVVHDLLRAGVSDKLESVNDITAIIEKDTGN